jgi:hypothetical protein
MNTRLSNHVRFVSVLCLAVWAVAPRAAAQAPAGLDLHLYAGLTITGAIGTVYSVEYVTDLAQTNTPSAWRCLEYLQLPASPYLWADKSAPPTAKRFYRVVAFTAPTNMVFIPPGTFRMGSPTNEVDRSDREGPQKRSCLHSGCPVTAEVTRSSSAAPAILFSSYADTRFYCAYSAADS